MRLVVVFLSIAVLQNSFATGVAPYIFGGDRVKSGDRIAKSVIAIGYFGQFGCSATILDDDLALTAAHCIDTQRKPSLIFSINANDFRAPTREVKGYEIHPDFRADVDSEQIFGDIAIMRFSGGLPSGFEKVDLLAGPLQAGDDVTLAGFGIAQASFTDPTGAGSLRTSKGVKVRTPDFRFDLFEFDQSKGSGACYGDSGGGALVERNGKLFQIGIASWVSTPDCSEYVYYVKPSAYETWMKDAIERLRKQP